jgi:hypothetical protein
MAGRLLSRIGIGVLLLACSATTAVPSNAAANATATVSAGDPAPSPATSRVAIQAYDQAVEVILQGEHTDHLESRIMNPRFVNPELFSFDLVNMSLSSGQASAKYAHRTGAVSEVDADQRGHDLRVVVRFRQPTSRFQEAVGGGFMIDVSFS